MGKPKTLLEDLCRHALACNAQAIEVEHKADGEWVFLRKGDEALKAAIFESGGRDAVELLENLAAARKKPVRTAIGGQVWILTVEVSDSLGKDTQRVRIDPAPKRDPDVAPRFTKTQGRYLAFIHHYSKIHRRAPSELDLQEYFRTSPPTIHQMILTLELKGFIERTPGQARSIRVLVQPEHLPRLE